MTVAELIEKLNGYPGSTIVLVSAQMFYLSDHVIIEKNRAKKDHNHGDADWWVRWPGNPNEDNEPTTPVVIIY